jgi:hypothetical protein
MCDYFRGLAIGSLVLEVVSTAALMLLVVVVLLGADTQRSSNGEVVSMRGNMPASWEQELEFASRLIEQKEEALRRNKDDTSKDSEIIASLQVKLKTAKGREVSIHTYTHTHTHTHTALFFPFSPDTHVHTRTHTRTHTHTHTHTPAHTGAPVVA